MRKDFPDDLPEQLTAAAYPASRFLTIDPVTVHYVAHEHDTTPLYLGHHFYGSGANFLPLMDQLSLTTIAVDRPGFGLTTRPHRNRHTKTLYTRKGAALLAWQVLERLYGDLPVVLAGASAGGTHVLEMAALRPERVKGIVLIDAAITGDVGPPGWARPALRTPVLSPLGVRLVDHYAHTITKERVGRSWADPTRVSDDTVAPYQKAATMPGYAYGLYHSFVGDQPPDLRHVLARLDVPALVVAGAHDRVISPRAARQIAGLIKNGTYVEIPDAGHTPHEETPGALATLISQFHASL